MPATEIDLGLVVGQTGPTGPTGPQGVTGPIGPTGATPVKGVDYFTTADVNSIVSTIDSHTDTKLGMTGVTGTVKDYIDDQDGNAVTAVMNYIGIIGTTGTVAEYINNQDTIINNRIDNMVGFSGEYCIINTTSS